MKLRAAALAVLPLCLIGLASAEEPRASFEQRASTHVFVETAAGRGITVIMPAVRALVRTRSGVGVQIDWTADVVSGATQRVYADVVSGATRFSDVRNDLGARVRYERGRWSTYGAYRFGIERDYRAHGIATGGAVELFQRNTRLSLDYAHGFDRVCTQDNRGLPVPLRQPMLDSAGCFAGRVGRISEPVDEDALALGLTQSVHPRVLLALSGSYVRVDGFQSNPYRAVRLFSGAYEALEHHPRLRHRGALALRARYAVPRTRAALVGELRLYRDSWGLDAIHAELAWDSLHLSDRLRWRVSARYYQQDAVTFYQDAGTAAAYDRAGPRTIHFTGDRELAPLGDLGFGAWLSYRQPVGRVLEAIEVQARLDLIGYLRLGVQPPNAARSTGVIDALTAGVQLATQF